jgi:hypothetical protein
MSTTSITHRPTSLLAAAAAVAAVAAGALALSVSQDSGTGAPSGQTHSSVRSTPPQAHHAHAPTGGRVMIGE